MKLAGILFVFSVLDLLYLVEAIVSATECCKKAIFKLCPKFLCRCWEGVGIRGKFVELFSLPSTKFTLKKPDNYYESFCI